MGIPEKQGYPSIGNRLLRRVSLSGSSGCSARATCRPARGEIEGGTPPTHRNSGIIVLTLVETGLGEGIAVFDETLPVGYGLVG